MRKISCPHYLKILSKLSKHGLSYSLKRDSRSISKITFFANRRVSSIDTKLWEFFKQKLLLVIQISNIVVFMRSVGWILEDDAFFWNTWSSLSIGCNTRIGTKCDFKDWPWIFEAVAEYFPNLLETWFWG